MKKIIIDVAPWRTRCAITWEGNLHNLFFSSPNHTTLERVFFKGTVTKILPGIQTAFVEIGQERAGFLHISEIDRDLAATRISGIDEDDVEKKPARVPRSNLDISKILKEGESILVQVSKEPVYEKGAKLTTCFTLPGRFIVLMPNIARIGVSKKIESREERARLKEIIRQQLPEGMGAIIRTTSEGRDAKELEKDTSYLVNTWKNIQKAFTTAEPHERLHEDFDIALQVVRDHLDNNVESVVTNDPQVHTQLYRFIKNIAPEYSQKIKLYSGPTPIFEYYTIEKQIETALHKKVHLKSGGSLIIETTEAMTVVDVNTGKFIGKTNLEDTIFKTNIEAAEETVRQLKLRNIGGLIVIDFIDMSSQTNKQKLFNFFEKTLKEQDKFQSVVLKVSEFGLVQMTRKRSGKTLIQELMETCHSCYGLGVVKSLETECYSMLRKLPTDLKKLQGAKQATLTVSPKMFEHLTKVQYNAVLELEKQHKIKIILASDHTEANNQYKIEKN